MIPGRLIRHQGKDRDVNRSAACQREAGISQLLRFLALHLLILTLAGTSRPAAAKAMSELQPLDERWDVYYR